MPFTPPEQFNMYTWFVDARLHDGDGDRVALRTDRGNHTYAEVAGLAGRYAAALGELGVRQEERVVIALPDGPDFVGAFFGILKLGAVVVMVNPSQAPDALGGILAYSRATAVVVDPSSRPVIEQAAAQVGRSPALLDAGVELPVDGRGTVATHRDDPAVWLFSGGTTGRPKAVVQTHNSFANSTECYAKAGLGYRRDDVTISVPKLYFGYATGSNLLFPFSVGASAVLFPEHPTPEVLFGLVARHRPTILVTVPTMVNQMVSHPAAGHADMSSLRLATSAGEALPPALYHRWRDAFGVELLDGLGTAEMWHVFVSNLPGRVKPGTLGRAVPGFEVKVCDADGDAVPPGEVGQLWVRGNSRALGYWQNAAKTAEAFRGEWFVGGDLVRMDPGGWVTYVGRGDDALKVGGKWLVPAEVEGCLAGHDAVVDVAVVGVPDSAGLTKPYAFVVARDPTPGLEEELQRYVLDRLDPYKHPRRVFVVDVLPQTHLGKVDRGKLRALAQAEVG